MKRILFSLATVMLCYACASVAVTGRKQLSLVPNDQIIGMSKEQYAKVLTENKINTNAAIM